MAMILYSGNLVDKNIKLFLPAWENKFDTDRVQNELFDILNDLKNGVGELHRDSEGRIWIHQTEEEGSWVCIQRDGAIEIGFPHA